MSTFWTAADRFLARLRIHAADDEMLNRYVVFLIL